MAENDGSAERELVVNHWQKGKIVVALLEYPWAECSLIHTITDTGLIMIEMRVIMEP
jgi:hypothetical protein